MKAFGRRSIVHICRKQITYGDDDNTSSNVWANWFLGYTFTTGVEYTDAATVTVVLTPSGVESTDFADAATVLIDLQASGTEEHTTFDAAQ